MRKLPSVLAFLGFLALALSWSLGTPLLSAADEPEIVTKAAASVRGEFSGKETVVTTPSWESKYSTPDFIEVTYQLPHSLVEAIAKLDPQCYAFHEDVPATCTVTASANAANAERAGTTATSHMDYFPLYYLLVGWPSLFIGGSQAIYAMRIVSAVITALLLCAAFTTSIRRRGAAALGMLAAATPVAIYYGAVVNPSGLEISSAILAWASFLSLVRAEPGAPGMRRDRILFGISAALLIVTRPLGPLWLAVIVAVVLATSSGVRERIRRVLRGPGVWSVVAVLALALLTAGAWDLTQNTMGIIPHTNPQYTYGTGIYISFYQTPAYFAQMLGAIGWNDVPVPTFTNLLWYGVIAAFVLFALVLGNRRERLVLLALTALVLLFPLAFEAYAAANFGTGWQGRYTLPLAVGVPILSAEILVRRLCGTAWGRVPKALASILGATIALAYLCQVWWAWRRYSQGIFGAGLGHTIPVHAHWTPPIGWPAVLALALFGCATLPLVLWRSSDATAAADRGSALNVGADVGTAAATAAAAAPATAPVTTPLTGGEAEKGGEHRAAATHPMRAAASRPLADRNIPTGRDPAHADGPDHHRGSRRRDLSRSGDVSLR